MPLEFAQSIKVVVRAREFYFYQINYLQYKPGVAVRTFQPDDIIEFLRPDVAGQPISLIKGWQARASQFAYSSTTAMPISRQ